MTKIAFKMKLKEGFKDEYKRRHDNLWPEIKDLLQKSGISDYTIYFDEETHLLFAVQKQEGNASSQDLGSEEIIQKWWAYMADIMDTNADNSPVSIALEPVFHLS